MRVPIIICGAGGPLFFTSKERAEDYMEPEDVRNHEYEAFDASGMVLEIRILKKPRPSLLRLGTVRVETATLVETAVVEKELLAQHLREFLVAIGEPAPTYDLAQLIEASLKKCGHTE